MSESTSTTGRGGVGFAGLLTILFIGLKLGHVIDWPWIAVLAPLWFPLVVVLTVVAVVLFFAGIGMLVLALIGSLTPRPTTAEMRRRRNA